jgi:hypothetical protein
VTRSPRFNRSLQPWLDTFDPFNSFNFSISSSAGRLPTIQRVTVLQVWPRCCPYSKTDMDKAIYELAEELSTQTDVKRYERLHPLSYADESRA